MGNCLTSTGTAHVKPAREPTAGKGRRRIKLPDLPEGFRTELGSSSGMGGGEEDERTTGVIPCPEPILDHRRHEMTSLPIPDELLTEILLRLPTLADLVRASASCVSFHRVTSGRSFLRRYRKLHTPPLLGFFQGRTVFYPVIAQHPYASAASAVALAADFSFLPSPTNDWVLRDIRDGRVLLHRPMRVVFPEVVVCDPLHRRYLLLPPVAYDLVALVEDPILSNTKLLFEIFLVPPGYGDEAATADETSFRVIWMAQCKTRLVAFVFSSNTGQWQAVSSRYWSVYSAGLPQFYSRHYVYGCFYWLRADGEESKLLVLDTKTMELSIAVTPPEANSCFDFAMVEAGEGRPGMFVLADSGSDLSYFITQNDGGSSSQWLKVKTISLGSCVCLICNMEKHLLLHHGQSSLKLGCFTLDIETFELEKVCDLGFTFYELHFLKLRAYSNFPPSLLSLPTISCGVEKGPENEMLEEGCAARSSAESPRPSE